MRLILFLLALLAVLEAAERRGIARRAGCVECLQLGKSVQCSGEVAELRLGTAIGGDDDGAAILVGLDAGDQLGDRVLAVRGVGPTRVVIGQILLGSHPCSLSPPTRFGSRWVDSHADRFSRPPRSH